MTPKLLNDRGQLGRHRRTWEFGLGNEAQELEVFRFHGTYAAAKRAAIKRAQEMGHSIVESRRDG